MVMMAGIYWSRSGQQLEKEPLRIAMTPDVDRQRVIKKMIPVRKYLEKTLGRKIEIIVPIDYDTAVAALVSRQVDVGYLGGATYVLSRAKADTIPLVMGMRGNIPQYTTVFITKKDSGIHSLGEIKGKTHAFGDPQSTASSLIPQFYIKKSGLKLNEDITGIFTGGHDTAALAVVEGRADTASISNWVYQNMVREGRLNDQEIVVFFESEPHADYPWVAREGLDTETQDALTTAFLEMDDPEILRALNVKKWVKTVDADFEFVREVAIELGLIEKK